MPEKWTPVPHNEPDSRWEVTFAHPLGEGGFGFVYRGKDKCGESGKDAPRECAMKKVALTETTDRESFETELKLLQAVAKHENIIELYGSHVDSKEGWLFLEMVSGGELFDRLIDSGRLSERIAWPYISGIAKGIKHCHDRGIMHRDLKLENVMLTAADPNMVKVIDFGLALAFEVGKDGKVVERLITDTAGTQSYRAPEASAPPAEGYSPMKVDVWAMGIIAFSLVSGFFPLQEAKESDWRYRTLLADQQAGVGASASIYKVYKRKCDFSAELRDLIDGMLTIDQEKRFSVDDVVTHAWIAKEAPPADGPVYRGVCTDDDELMDDELPEDAVPLVRQKAARFAGAEIS